MLKKITFVTALCGTIIATASGGLGAQEASAPAAKPAKAGTATASIDPSKNELPDANAENNDPTRNTVGVAAIVNDSIISDYDLRQRMALILATTGQHPESDQEKKDFRAQVLHQLETEKMQIQEANRKKISITSEDVDKAVNKIVTENNLSLDHLKEVFAQKGTSIAALRAQLAVQLAWQKAVEDEYGGEIRLKPKEVDTEYARVKAGANKPHYLVAEIFLAVDNPELDEKVRKDAQDLYDQIKHGAPFNSVARSFSQSPSAANGGDVGTVEQGQLASELDAALVKMQPGEITQPIRSVGGYYILALRRKWEPANTKVETHTSQEMAATNATPLMRLLFPIGPKPPKNVMDNVLNIAGQIREHVQGCVNIDKIAAEMRGSQLQDLGKMGLHMSDLSEQIQTQLRQTKPGETTVPFVSPAGVELILRCDKPIPKTEVWEAPSRDDVENQIFEERISALARGYLARLRRDADVQER